MYAPPAAVCVDQRRALICQSQILGREIVQCRRLRRDALSCTSFLLRLLDNQVSRPPPSSVVSRSSQLPMASSMNRTILNRAAACALPCLPAPWCPCSLITPPLDSTEAAVAASHARVRYRYTTPPWPPGALASRSGSA